jgi:hypothetical protein
MRTNATRLLTVFAFGFFGEPAAASQEATDMRLADAGFVMRPANTPEKLKQLRLLPPRKIVRRKAGDGHYYLYADPDYCKCVLAGDERAMQTYRDMQKPPPGLPTVSVQPSGRSPESMIIQDMDDDIPVADDNILRFRF